jgi:beta-lactamase superfamily II metal-dependent hydrolase
MGIEIDFLAVGDDSKSGDAIAVRFGNLHSRREEQTVITIDGGTEESGQDLVEHIKTHYGTESVDYAFLTHPDGDHASGMRVVLENLAVSQVVMHRPWEHSTAIHDLFDDGRTTPESISERSRENLSAAHEVEQLAIEKGIDIVEPFAGVGTADGIIRVIGPTRDFYRESLARFDYMPDLIEVLANSLSMFSQAAERSINWVAEKWDADKLVDPAEDSTSAENNSSMILLITVNDKHYLFTGDAGVPALSGALDYATNIGVDWSKLRFLQGPHHGSKRNVGPALLNRLLGPPKPVGSIPDKTAFISAAKSAAPKHPNKRVTNAFLRRGVKSFVTAGQAKRHHDDAPPRSGWTTATPVPFYDQVEDDD